MIHLNALAERFRGSRVLITGGLGFIGSNLARQLVDMGADVTLLDSLVPTYGGSIYNIDGFTDRVTVNVSDVRDKYSLEYLLKDRDYLFNLAGQTSHVDSMLNPVTDLDINAGAQLSILEACKNVNSGIRIVFASTRQIYGRPEYLPVDENHPLRPVDVNGVNKIAGEFYHQVYNDVYGIRSCSLRLTNTYGPRMRVKDARQTFLGIWVKNVVQGTPFAIFGDGLQVRDYNYVDDVVEALLRCAVHDDTAGTVFNMGAEAHYSLLETAQMLARIEPSARFEIVPFPSERKAIDIGDYYGTYEKLNRVTGWEPRTSLEEGLTRTLDYYRKAGSRYW